MKVNALLQRQWIGYSTTHQNRTNLSLHLVAVPLFMIGTLAALYGLIMLSPFAFIIAVLGLRVLSFCKGAVTDVSRCNRSHSRTYGISCLESSSSSGLHFHGLS